MDKFETQLKNALNQNTESLKPNKESFLVAIKEFVTNKQSMRYNIQTATFKFINNNKVTDFISSFISRKIIWVPSFIALFLVGAFTLSPQGQNIYTKYQVQNLAEQNALIENEVYDEDDQIILSTFDEQAIDELSNINENEI